MITIRLFATILAMIAAMASLPGKADVVVGPPPPEPRMHLSILIYNATNAPVEFHRSHRDCVSVSPESFTVGALEQFEIDVTWDFTDAKELCYSAVHRIGYEDKASSKNSFEIRQYASSNDSACLDLKLFYGITINNAICPVFSGNVHGPRNDPNNAGSALCPNGAPQCPPSDDGTEDNPAVNGTEYWGFVISNSALSGPETVHAIEYFHAGFGHYFVTAIPDETARLDTGAIPGWRRTGQYFKAYPASAPGALDVCRFVSVSFAPKYSHFHTSSAEECAALKVDPNWQFEGTVFAVDPPDGSGDCAAGMQPLFRIYNNGYGGAPNHRYTAQTVDRTSMLRQRWVSEGVGAMGSIGCVPI